MERMQSWWACISFPLRQDKKKMVGDKMEEIQFASTVWHKFTCFYWWQIDLQVVKRCLHAAACLSFGLIGTKMMSKKVLISTLPSWARRYCRVQSGWKGGTATSFQAPNLKKGQIQSNINHFALRSVPSAIVIEQTNGKRPVAGGNKKPFDNYRVKFLPRSSQHLQKPKGATSGCQHHADI